MGVCWYASYYFDVSHHSARGGRVQTRPAATATSSIAGAQRMRTREHGRLLMAGAAAAIGGKAHARMMAVREWCTN